MDTEIKIVDAKESEFEDVVILLRQLWPDKTLNNLEVFKVFRKSIKSEYDKCLSAKLDGKTVGFCAIVFANNFWQEGVIAQISTMVVHEEYRNRGIGKKLLQAAIAIARKRNCKKLELESSFHRKTAHDFYEKNGFKKRAYYFSIDI
ncbi:MAG TPA: GNAT family N-acetyltransferase [Candidatus Brocadiaceae bacterium]